MKLEGLKKIEGIKKLQKYNLPMPETIFIFNFKKQEKEIEKFLENKKIITIRSDKKGNTDFCPNDLRCPKNKTKAFIKKITKNGYAVILQEYLPIRKNRIFSGNILVLKNHIIMELMGVGPLTWLNREGKMKEQIKFKKDNLRELEHSGRKLVRKKKLINIAKLVKNIPPYKILEFTLLLKGPFFWQIKEDKTSKRLDKN
jgi:hypothetical protein